MYLHTPIHQAKAEVEKRNIGIDLLRGCCILYIVGFWHLMNYTDAFPGYSNKATNKITAIILGTFVFISGFLIGKKDLSLEKQNLLNFYKKRFVRIYPLYVFAIVLFWLFNISDAITSLKAILMISMFVKPAPFTLWFITMIFLFYVISPFLLKAIRTVKIRKLLLYYLLLNVLLIIYYFLTRKLDVRVMLYFPPYVMGMFLAQHKYNLDLTLRNKLLFCLLFIVSLLISFIKTPFNNLNILMEMPLVLTGAIFLFELGGGRFQFSDGSKSTQFIFILSYVSFCMYLFHRPIYITLKILYFPEQWFAQISYLIFFCLPVVVFVSYLIQKTYDTVLDNTGFALR
jgi:peptidoglycan/LPS O-acetylase OafA/YrhL